MASRSRIAGFALMAVIGIGGFYLLVTGINRWVDDVSEQHCDRVARTMHRIEAAERSEAQSERKVSEACEFHDRKPGVAAGGSA